MSANSIARRLAKRALAPLLDERAYRVVQAASMARDIRAGRFSEPEIDIALAALRPGDVAIDLGANYGMYTIPLARRVEATGKVFAFEPVPFTAATLHTVCRLLRTSNVDLRAKACGEEHGVMTFSVPVQSSGALSAGQAHAASRVDTRPGHEEHVRWDRSREVTCEVVPLDEELSQVDEIALIKADIEGMELFAFRGAQRIIERDVPTVISEINPWFLDGFGISVDDLLAFFSSRGYDLYRWNEPSRRLRTVTAPEEVVEDNYVFVHPRRADRLADLTA